MMSQPDIWANVTQQQQQTIHTRRAVARRAILSHKEVQ